MTIQVRHGHYDDQEARTANMGFAKMGADGSRVSTFVFQFGFISSRTLLIKLCRNHQLLFINLASVSRADGILFPPLRQALNVSSSFMHRKIVILSTIVFMACNYSRQSKENLNKAIENYKSENYAAATKYINEACKLDSSNKEIQFWNAKIKEQTKNCDDAINILKRLVLQGYKIDSCYYLISRNYFQLGHYNSGKTAYREAVIFADSAINLNSVFYEAYQMKIRSLYNIDEYNEGFRTTNHAVSLFPDSTQLLMLRGLFKHQLGDNDAALIDLDVVITKKSVDSPDIATALRFKGYILLDRDSLNEALENLSEALRYNPKDEFIYEQRARCYIKKNLIDSACMDFRKSADLGLLTVYDDINKYCAK